MELHVLVTHSINAVTPAFIHLFYAPLHRFPSKIEIACSLQATVAV